MGLVNVGQTAEELVHHNRAPSTGTLVRTSSVVWWWWLLPHRRRLGKVEDEFLHARLWLKSPTFDAQALLLFGQAKAWAEDDWKTASFLKQYEKWKAGEYFIHCVMHSRQWAIAARIIADMMAWSRCYSSQAIPEYRPSRQNVFKRDVQRCEAAL